MHENTLQSPISKRRNLVPSAQQRGGLHGGHAGGSVQRVGGGLAAGSGEHGSLLETPRKGSNGEI